MTVLAVSLVVVTVLALLLAAGTTFGPRILCALTGHMIVGRRMTLRRVAEGRLRYVVCRRCEQPVDLTRARW